MCGLGEGGGGGGVWGGGDGVKRCSGGVWCVVCVEVVVSDCVNASFQCAHGCAKHNL